MEVKKKYTKTFNQMMELEEDLRDPLELIQTQVYLRWHQIEKLKAFKQEAGIPMAQIIRSALDRYLEALLEK